MFTHCVIIHCWIFSYSYTWINFELGTHSQLSSLLYSEDDFQEFEAAFEKLDLAIQKDKFVEKFKKNLYESIKSQITTNWERIGINDKLKLLLYYKGQSSSDEKQFRPTGRTAEEQLRHLEVKALLKKKQCYENYIAYNKEQLTVNFKDFSPLNSENLKFQLFNRKWSAKCKKPATFSTISAEAAMNFQLKSKKTRNYWQSKVKP